MASLREQILRRTSVTAMAAETGVDWAAAIDDIEWVPGDVLAVGSRTAGPLARVLLGSRASKIVRHSPVPIVVCRRAR